MDFFKYISDNISTITCCTGSDQNLWLAKLLFFSTAMSTVGWNRFQNNFYMDNGLTSVQIGSLKSIGLVFKFIGDPLISFLADATDAKRVFILTMVMQVLTMELLRIMKPLSYQFILFVKILRTATAPSATLTTSASFKLTEGTNQGFGQQRMFGSLAWGSGAFIAGFLIDKFGMMSIFYYTYFFNVISLLFVIFGIPAKFTKSLGNSSNLELAELDYTERQGLLESPTNKQQDNNNSIITKFYNNMIYNKKFKDLQQFLLNQQCRIVLINSFIFGIVMTVPDTFLYISLERDYNASRTFSGLCTTISTMSCLPLFWYSESLIKRFGHNRMIVIAELTCVFRLLAYALIPLHTVTGEYMIITVQLLHGFNFALFLSAAIDIIFKLAPKELSISCISTFNVVHGTLAGAVGNIIWGYIYDYCGGVIVVYCISALVCLLNVLYFIKVDNDTISSAIAHDPSS